MGSLSTRWPQIPQIWPPVRKDTQSFSLRFRKTQPSLFPGSFLTPCLDSSAIGWFWPAPTPQDSFWFPFKIEAREPTRKESAKVRNRRLRKKFNGTAQKPRLSIFCSSKHLYAELVDDSKKKTLAFASTAQESIRDGARIFNGWVTLQTCQQYRKKSLLKKLSVTSSWNYEKILSVYVKSTLYKWICHPIFLLQ